MLWHWSWGQHLEVSILSGGKRQRPEYKLGVEMELHVESPRCHGLPGRILSVSPFLARLCRRLVVRYMDLSMYFLRCPRCITGYYFYSQENRLIDMISF
jgi:hypothetical protein